MKGSVLGISLAVDKVEEQVVDSVIMLGFDKGSYSLIAVMPMTRSSCWNAEDSDRARSA